MKVFSIPHLVFGIAAVCLFSFTDSRAAADAQTPIIDPVAPVPVPSAITDTTAPPSANAQAVPPSIDDAMADDENDDADDADDESIDSGEGESRDAVPDIDPGVVYSADISDADLARRFVADLGSLGSLSIGFADEGRLVNAMQMPRGVGESWVVVSPEHAWGARETIEALMAAADSLHQRFPRAAPLRVNHISQKEGGYTRPHKSHQSGRDADLGFFYDDNCGSVHIRDRRPVMDAALNWALVRDLVTRADVQVVLVDRKIATFLHDYALSIGEDPTWLASIFSGAHPLVQHARRHRDHFHVRFFAPRSQELGRRVQPLLAKRADTNVMVYRVRSGDTLGHIAARYNSSIEAIKKRNNMRNSFLSVARTLVVPLRGPCTKCPLPPPLVIPAKRLPPMEQNAQAQVDVQPARS